MTEVAPNELAPLGRWAPEGGFAPIDDEDATAENGPDFEDEPRAKPDLPSAHDARPHSWLPVDLLSAGDTPPEPPTICGLFYPGRNHLLSGETEALKTWLALVACAEEINAGNAVLYVDYENGPREMLSRFRAIGLSDGQIREQVIYLQPDEPLSDPLVLADVLATLERGPTITVIDSYTGALATNGLDPGSGIDIERFTRTVINPLRSGGAAAITLDHLVKNKESRGRYSIGSERKASAAEVHLGAEVVRPFVRGGRGLLKLRVHKDRGGYHARPHAAQVELHSDPDTGLITWTIQPAEHAGDDRPSFRPTVLMQRVSEYLERQAAPVTRHLIAENVTGKRQYKFAAIACLIAEGYATEQDTGGIISERPFREAQDA